MPPVLRTVTRTQGNNAALKAGIVTTPGFTLEFEEVPVLVDAFRAMVRHLAYDVCEMAVTTYLCAKEHGVAFTALPVFLVRGFHHKAIVCRADDQLTPADLAGRRVGVSRGYTVTTGVWARGVLREEYGVPLDEVTWVLSGDEHVAAYQPPSNVEPMPPGRSLIDLLLAGDLDAVVGVTADRPELRTLLPDADEAGYTALRERGHYPINHLVVVRDELLAAYPTLAGELTTAFLQSKDLYVKRLAEGPTPDETPTDTMYRRVMRETGADPLPYGLAANRACLDRLVDHALDQRILTRAPRLDALFALTEPA